MRFSEESGDWGDYHDNCHTEQLIDMLKYEIIFRNEHDRLCRHRNEHIDEHELKVVIARALYERLKAEINAPIV